MKKRHEQKLILLSIGLIVLLNIPFVLVYNTTTLVFGLPVFYFSIFIICGFSVLVSYYILKRFYE
jgi:hypothetical protein